MNTSESLAKHVVPRSLRIGMIRKLSHSTLERGWLWCEGQWLEKSSYPLLDQKFSAAGYPWTASGDSFKIPDLRGRSGMGKGQGPGPLRTIGQYTGEHDHQLTIAEMPAHTHRVSPVHYVSSMIHLYNEEWDVKYGDLATSTSNAGSGNVHENMQPYIGCRYAIYTGVSV